MIGKVREKEFIICATTKPSVPPKSSFVTHTICQNKTKIFLYNLVEVLFVYDLLYD